VKNLIGLFLFVVFSSSIILSQDETTTGELNFYIKNNNGSNVRIDMELISSLCWNTDPNDVDLHDTTHSFGGGFLNTYYTNDWLEFLACWETTQEEYFRTFGLGYYKFTVRVNNVVKDYFYIDYRTSDLPENFSSEGNGDINLTFDVADGKIYYWNTTNEFPDDTEIWTEKDWIDDIKTVLEPLAPDNLNLTSSGGHPYLTWSHSTNTGDYWTGYKIYREICAGGNPYFTEDDWIATVGKYTTGYIDPTYYVGHGWEGYYCVKAINGSRGSDFSEVLEIGIDAFGKDREEIQPETEFYLSQNYPNPFNPLTMISFSLKDNSNVTLKVFDILGREVAVLVNGTLTAGNHQVQFNGSGLESGVYFYEIKAENFRDVKKLILTK
jgi:hypothetical protein